MADLDEVSKQIGQLISLAESTRNQVGTLFSKFDKLNEETIEQRGAIKILGSQFAAHAMECAEHRRANADLKAEFEATKNKGKGLAIGLTLVGGGGGMAGFMAALKSFLGSGG